MSLAEELIADLEEVTDKSAYAPVSDNCINMDSAASVRSYLNANDTAKLKQVMECIERRSNDQLTMDLNKKDLDGPVEAHPEYKLIVDATAVTVVIEDNINIIHKFVKAKYSKRFPELDSLVPSALEYLISARELGNDLSRAKNNEKLASVLTQATVMVVTIMASNTQGKLLSDEELNSIIEAADMAIELNECKIKIFDFVGSRMSFIAPNVSAIVGANIAAKLMGIAGGLTNLSKMPACNVEVLGAKKKTLTGFSSTSVMPHTGFIYFTDIVQNTPPDLRRKANRLVANKCTIAARVDASHVSPDGSQGKAFREQIEKALDKLMEPPPVKQVKPLAAPIDQPRKKRGGKRVRRMKDRLAMTEFRKQQNRMNFGEIEEDAYQDDLGFTTGQIGKSTMGRIRTPQIDEKTKVRISKALQKNLQKQQTYGGNTTVRRQISGTASVAFTPLQGLEIMNPQAAEKTTESDAKYFSSTSGFFSIIKRT